MRTMLPLPTSRVSTEAFLTTAMPSTQRCLLAPTITSFLVVTCLMLTTAIMPIMPITVTGFSCETHRHSLAPETQFAGRVVRIMERAETRNVSGTLDYTDNEHLTAVYALVWLGEHGVPPEDRYCSE